MPTQIEQFSGTVIERIEVDTKNTKQVHDPILRVALDGGCTLEHCNCSPDPFITISDGTTILMVKLSREDAETIAHEGRLYLGPR